MPPPMLLTLLRLKLLLVPKTLLMRRWALPTLLSTLPMLLLRPVLTPLPMLQTVLLMQLPMLLPAPSMLLLTPRRTRCKSATRLTVKGGRISKGCGLFFCLETGLSCVFCR
jgi:hypothetical protein